MRRWEGARRSLRFGGLVLAGTLLLAGCGEYPGATEQAKPIHHLYDVLFVVATIIFVLVEAAILWASFRYRRRKNDDGSLPPQFHGNTFLEIAWTVIPLAIVLTLFAMSFQVINKVDAETKNPDVTINILAFQWQWQFTYAGQAVQVEPGQPPQDLSIKGTIANPPHIYLPVGEKIHFNEQSKDVIHSFYVPEFLFKRDLIPGRTNSFEITPTKIGVYHGQCAQFCGLGHNAMHFYIHVVSPADYQSWLAEAKKRFASGCPTDTSPGHITAKNIAFDKECLRATAGKPFTLVFDNQDSGVLHNVVVFNGRDASAPPLTPAAERAPFAGPKTMTYTLPALKPGRYYYHCDVHPTAMTGFLIVK